MGAVRGLVDRSRFKGGWHGASPLTSHFSIERARAHDAPPPLRSSPVNNNNNKDVMESVGRFCWLNYTFLCPRHNTHVHKSSSSSVEQAQMSFERSATRRLNEAAAARLDPPTLPPRLQQEGIDFQANKPASNPSNYAHTEHTHRQALAGWSIELACLPSVLAPPAAVAERVQCSSSNRPPHAAGSQPRMGAQSTKLLKEVARDSKCVLCDAQRREGRSRGAGAGLGSVDRYSQYSHTRTPSPVAPMTGLLTPHLTGPCCRGAARGPTSSSWRGARRWRRSCRR
jgi:hypothetical protein